MLAVVVVAVVSGEE
ncbi:hypothetical protein V1477_017679 [Vespula maculifrons]|uniref:Uncharacterized protein n=1 Tax=Vespula maculifrons TaxID=7453 RepID=A0ABD2B736_VESMC